MSVIYMCEVCTEGLSLVLPLVLPLVLVIEGLGKSQGISQRTMELGVWHSFENCKHSLSVTCFNARGQWMLLSHGILLARCTSVWVSDGISGCVGLLQGVHLLTWSSRAHVLPERSDVRVAAAEERTEGNGEKEKQRVVVRW